MRDLILKLLHTHLKEIEACETDAEYLTADTAWELYTCGLKHLKDMGLWTAVCQYEVENE